MAKNTRKGQQERSKEKEKVDEKLKPTVKEAVELIEKLPQEDKKEVVQVVSEMFMGPIPHPELFKRYEEILPGSADRILKMSEEQMKHRQELEKAMVYSSIKDGSRGQITGFIIGVLGILAGFILILLDKDVYGLSLIIVDIATLVGIFIYGRESEKKERIAKQNDDYDKPTPNE